MLGKLTPTQKKKKISGILEYKICSTQQGKTKNICYLVQFFKHGQDQENITYNEDNNQ